MVLAGAITIDPNVPPSAGHVRDLRRLLKTGAVKCIFAEPQFNNKIIRTITEGTKTKLAQLDPLGADLPEGEGSYEAVIQNLTNEIYGCLK
jgi:zinc transport system substrate-binding protein